MVVLLNLLLLKPPSRRNWVFREGGWRIKIHRIGGIVEKIVFETGWNYAGKEGDTFLILRQNESEWRFIEYGVLSNVERKADEEAGNWIFTISVSDAGLLKSNRLLKDYSYTLPRIRDFDKPYKHFRVYSRISNVEFEAIIKGDIFIARTAFGKLVQAMHKDHRFGFQQYLIKKGFDVFYSNKDYLKAVTLLTRYISTHIMEPVNQLNACQNMLYHLVPEDEVLKIGFESDNGKVDLISKQVKNVSTLQRTEADWEFLGELDIEIEQNIESERKFIELFKKHPLPIKLL